MITTIREIGQTTGESFNDVLASYLFSYGSNQYTSIADALRLAKIILRREQMLFLSRRPSFDVSNS